eukprot:TRINITY_DN1801_c0_g1_i1.p1 TRINITY_DN1801_c0_g1~~TRINITY_DN1801_c0_g1_i1.p1  ORF type:complete len:215 (-),score=67.98 TRINITY_DN1801_c0_g1_i1:32-676(-)
MRRAGSNLFRTVSKRNYATSKTNVNQIMSSNSSVNSVGNRIGFGTRLNSGSSTMRMISGLTAGTMLYYCYNNNNIGLNLVQPLQLEENKRNSTNQNKNVKEESKKKKSLPDAEQNLQNFVLDEVFNQAEPELQHQLGVIHHNNGRNEEAKKWLLKAARQGYASSQLTLGLIAQEEGKEEEAKRWLLKAAQSNDVTVSKNAKKALETLKTSKRNN